MRKLILWMTQHPTLAVSLFMLTTFLLLNVLAFRHARAMTHYVSTGGRARHSRTERDHNGSRTLLEKVRLAVNGVTVERPEGEARPDEWDLPYEKHVFAGDGGRLAAWYVPHEHSAGLVVLFHGYAADKSRLLPEMRAFHDLGYACFLVDFRGSGGSDGDRTSVGYHEADDVVRSVAYVRRHWPNEPLILFGQSMGAAAVLRALSRHALQAEAMVLECPFDRLLSTVQARFACTGLPSFPAAQLLVFWGGLQHGYNGFDHNPADYARRATCPALLLHGRCDPRVSCRQIESIYRNLAGVKQLHIFDDVGHESYAAKRPEEWKERVACFLRCQVPVNF